MKPFKDQNGSADCHSFEPLGITVFFLTARDNIFHSVAGTYMYLMSSHMNLSKC